MKSILQNFQPISLDEMSGVKLLNRTDTKFVTSLNQLRKLLSMAEHDYRVQEINGQRIAHYYSTYFDTPTNDMYMRHQNGHQNRQKLRIRSYVDSHLNFLEVKTKNNHGRTKKKRIPIVQFDPLHPNYQLRFGTKNNPNAVAENDFLEHTLLYDLDSLTEKLENRFERVTLVNRNMTERLTIDTNLYLHNLETDEEKSLEQLVIIELKRDGLIPSPIIPLLRELRIMPIGFSKYTMGQALTNSNLKHNRLKPRIHQIEKLIGAQLL